MCYTIFGKEKEIVKNLKNMLGLLVVSTLALVGMTNVHATAVANNYENETKTKCNDTKACAASIDDHYYDTLDDALKDAIKNKDDVITILKDISTTSLGAESELTAGITDAEIKTKLTIDLGKYNVTLNAKGLVVGDEGDLTIKGTGSIVGGSKTDAVITVAAGGKLTTSGALELKADGEKTVIANSGDVVIGTGAELSTTGAGKIIDVAAHESKTELNAKVGTSTKRSEATVINFSVEGGPSRNQTPAYVVVKGGSYYTKENFATVDNGVKLVVNGGTIDTTGEVAGAIVATDGTLEINGGTIINAGRTLGITGDGEVAVKITAGTIKSTAGFAVETDAGKTTGSLTITGGTIKTEAGGSRGYSPLYLQNDGLTYSVAGGTFEGPKNTPAIYIDDNLLTGMPEDGEADPFKGMVTGGKFLFMIIGEAKDVGTTDKDFTADEVTKYILGEKVEVKTDGNYLVVGNGDTQKPDDQEPGQAGPGDDEPSKSPATFDAIGGLVTMAISSLGVVGTATKKLFR